MKTREKTTFDVTPVWKQVNPELREELLDFWQQNRAIGDIRQAQQRASQAICIARGDDGRLCAVSTAVLCVLPRLRQPLYYYRLFLAKSVRGQGRVLPFFDQCRRVLQQYNQKLDQPESVGILMELENRHLSAPQLRGAILEEIGAVFIGHSPRGFPMRVRYFDGAQLMRPQQVMEIVRQAEAA